MTTAELTKDEKTEVNTTKNENKDFVGEYPAEGLLAMGGFLFYGLGCVFVYDDVTLPTLRLSADGFGDDFDADTSEMIGAFNDVPENLEGECWFDLKAAEFEEGVIELKIMKTKNGPVVGRFTGDSEGLGESILRNKKGKLEIPSTKEHNNDIIFEGKDGIESIEFVYGNQYSITAGQPWGGVETTSGNNGSKLTIDVGAGRKNNKEPAQWYNDTVNSDTTKMFHSRGGNNVPKKLHFAFNGVLSINGDSFNVSMGQGEDFWYNNWHIASPEMVSTESRTTGTFANGKYRIWSTDSYHFKISKEF
ncbi:hypothetical protein [Agaribacterium sp. ZY112]|uniref:hypothetical protein n=1 Tax=Agaribacterium sp. ZY112 TaxID=3233574 RepID=UPI003525E18B